MKDKGEYKNMEIMKVKNYKVFAETLKKKTGCEVSIKIINKDHFYYLIIYLYCDNIFSEIY